MVVHLTEGLTLLLLAISVNAFPSILGPQGVNLWKTQKARQQTSQKPAVALSTTANFTVQYFTQPLDHFSENNTYTFQQRYWVNDRHYKVGSKGPIIILDSGEDSGDVSDVEIGLVSSKL